MEPIKPSLIPAGHDDRLRSPIDTLGRYEGYRYRGVWLSWEDSSFQGGQGERGVDLVDVSPTRTLRRQASQITARSTNPAPIRRDGISAT
jgi:hypothetical protein